MNTLRNLLDSADSKQVGVASERFHSGVAFKAIRRSLALAENAMCFDFGDMTSNHGSKVFWDSLRLPFPTIWCEFSQGQELQTLGVLIHEEEPGKWWLVTAFFRMAGQWVIWNSGVAVLSGDRQSGLYWHSHDDKTDEQATNAFAAAAWGISAVNCTNVTRREIAPEPKLQRARLKRGKKPLFSYWVLELAQTERSESSGNGSHASPRLHLRRGHPRQYAPGKWTWVQPCAVGNKALGIVHKDYRLAGLPHNGEGVRPERR